MSPVLTLQACGGGGDERIGFAFPHCVLLPLGIQKAPGTQRRGLLAFIWAQHVPFGRKV